MFKLPRRRNFSEPTVLVPVPTQPAAQWLPNDSWTVKLPGHNADFQHRGGKGVQLHLCVACFPPWHLTDKSHRSASCNLHIDLYVTNVAQTVLSNCSQDIFRNYSSNVRDCELFVIFYIYIYIYIYIQNYICIFNKSLMMAPL